jgi:hypothetical protein
VTKDYDEPKDSSQRVNDVLARADALSDELRRTIAELTRLLQAETKGAASAGKSVYNH